MTEIARTPEPPCWADEAAMLEWKKNLEHREAQRMGRKSWYESFRVRIARVEREYGK